MKCYWCDNEISGELTNGLCNVCLESGVTIQVEQTPRSVNVNQRVSLKVADTLNMFNLGDEVEISMISEHYRDFVGEKFKIVGIELNKNDKLLYTIKDKYGLSDEWEESDLTKSIG